MRFAQELHPKVIPPRFMTPSPARLGLAREDSSPQFCKRLIVAIFAGWEGIHVVMFQLNIFQNKALAGTQRLMQARPVNPLRLMPLLHTGTTVNYLDPSKITSLPSSSIGISSVPCVETSCNSYRHLEAFCALAKSQNGPTITTCLVDLDRKPQATNHGSEKGQHDDDSI